MDTKTPPKPSKLINFRTTPAYDRFLGHLLEVAKSRGFQVNARTELIEVAVNHFAFGLGLKAPPRRARPRGRPPRVDEKKHREENPKGGEEKS